MQGVDIRNTRYGDVWRESRKAFLDDVALCRSELLTIYKTAAANVAHDVAHLSTDTSPSGKISLRAKRDLEKSLDREISALAIASETRIRGAVQLSFNLGAVPMIELAAGSFAEIADIAKVRGALQAVHAKALEAYQVEKRYGWTFSERIWKSAATTSKTIQEVVSAGLAEGMDSVKVARMLEQYVKDGSKTLSSQYPNMMKRMGGRVPGNVSYESLRLARTEASYAFNEGTIQAARENPAVGAIGFRLSNSHPAADICDSVASADSYGLGRGNYPVEEAPSTQHPCCLCYLVPIARDISEALRVFELDPSQEPDIQDLADQVEDLKASAVTLSTPSIPYSPSWLAPALKSALASKIIEKIMEKSPIDAS